MFHEFCSPEARTINGLQDELTNLSQLSRLKAEFGSDHKEKLSGAPARHLSLFAVGTDSTAGCWLLSDHATSNSFDVSQASCNFINCPSCFISPTSSSQAITLTITGCSTHRWGIGTATHTRSGVWGYTFINRDSTNTMTVTDGGGSWLLSPLSYVHAYCDSASGANRLLFTTATVDSLTVSNGFTLNGGNFDASASSGTFQTSSGAISLNGAVTAADGFTLSSGAFDASASTGTFATSSGAVSLNGAVTMAQGLTITSGNFDASGSTGTFQTSTGAVSLKGSVTCDNGFTLSSGSFDASASTGAFSTGSGSVTFNGPVSVTGTNTLTVGSAGTAGATRLYGDVTVGGASAGQAADIDVFGAFRRYDHDSARNVISSASNGVTLKGTLSLDGGTTVSSGNNLAIATYGTIVCDANEGSSVNLCRAT
eukprot:symbB.v1.2.006666.t1/scaffold372.1/size218212/18